MKKKMLIAHRVDCSKVNPKRDQMEDSEAAHEGNIGMEGWAALHRGSILASHLAAPGFDSQRS